MNLISSKITLARERERRYRKSEEEESWRGEKNNVCTLKLKLMTFCRVKRKSVLQPAIRTSCS